MSSISTLSIARSPGLAGYRALVAAGWFTVALCVLLLLTDRLHFTFNVTTGIQGWVTVNRYPKQQEMFWFLAAVAGIPAVMLSGWALWVFFAAVMARQTGHPPADLLKAHAVWHLPLLIAWLRLGRLRVDAWELALPAAAAGLLLCVPSLRFVRRFSPRSPRSFAVGALPQPARPAAAEAAAGTSAAATPVPPTVRGARMRWLRRAATGVILFAGVPVVACLVQARSGAGGDVDLFHEGEFLIPMDEMLRGGVPYRDFYLQHGLFHNALIPWLGAKIFEPTLMGLRTVQRFTEPLGSGAACLLVLAACRTRLLAALLLGVLLCGSRLEVPGRAVFGLLSVAVLAAAMAPAGGCHILDAGRPGRDPFPGLRPALHLSLRQGWPFPLAGALAMLAFWHSVEVGLYALSTGALFLGAAGGLRRGIAIWRRPLPLLLHGVGAAVVSIPVLAYLGAHGAVADMLRNLWVQCAYQTDTWGLPFRGFFSVFGPLLTDPFRRTWPEALAGSGITWYAGPLALTLAAALLAFRATGEGFWRSRTAPPLLLLTLAGSFFFRTALGRSDKHHLHYGTLFAVVLAIFLADRLATAAWDRFAAPGASVTGRLAGVPWLAAALLPAVPLVWFARPAVEQLADLGKRWAGPAGQPLGASAPMVSVPRTGAVKVSDRQAAYIRAAVDYLREHSRPDEAVFDFSSTAGLLFFADRRPATRYFQVCYAALPALQEEVVRDLERQRVSLVVFRSGKHDGGFDEVPIERRHPVIAAHLRERYEPADTVGEVVFWRRCKEAAGASGPEGR